MTSEVITDAQPKEVSIALLENKHPVEYQREPRETSFSVGNIHMARVKKLIPGPNACFVDVGYERDTFLHYLDLESQFNSYAKYLEQVQSDRKRLYPIQKATRLPDSQRNEAVRNTLQVGQEAMVQVIRESTSTKEPRLTDKISFVGRFLVLIPFGHKVSVSFKIKGGEKRTRLKQFIQNIAPKSFGIIVRTIAEEKCVAELDAEMKVLLSRWNKAITRLQKTQKRPQLVFEGTGRVVAMLRDLFNPTCENIYVNDGEIYTAVRHYVSLITPEKAGIVKKYTGKVPTFDNFDVTKQIKSNFGKTTDYGRGYYLITRHTEAMHVMDVNNGNGTKEKAQEQNALDTSPGAADELTCQLRLHDMGGIVVVDFIDMNLAEDRQMLYEYICRNMQKDRACHNILPLSKFGLIQITRQCVRPVMDVDVDESCPTCFDTGKIRSGILLTDQLERRIDRLVNKVGVKEFYLHVHPYVAAYINEDLISLKRKWRVKYGLGINIIPSQKLTYLQYGFYDVKQQFIDMREQNDKS